MCAFLKKMLCFDRVYRLQEPLASRPSTTAAQESMANDATSVSGWHLLSHRKEMITILTDLQRLLTRPVSSSFTP